MTTASTVALTEDRATRLQERILREQVALQFSNFRSSTIADALLAWALCGLLYWLDPSRNILIWLVLHGIQILRYPFVSAYFKNPQAAEHSAFWGRRHTREIVYYSSPGGWRHG